MIFNLLLTNLNATIGYGTTENNNGLWILITILLFVIIALIGTISIISIKFDDYKKQHQNYQNSITEEEKQTIAEYRKLTGQEKQIIKDTISTFNKPKE